MMGTGEQRTREAVDWLIRQQDPVRADWAAFTEWLEADPANADEYQRLAILDAGVAERVAGGASPAVERTAAPARRRLPALGWRTMAPLAAGLAACLAIFVVPSAITSGPQLYAVQTPPGVRQSLVLAGRTTLALNGGTRILLDRSNPRFARLLEGEASFDIEHDADRPFAVEVGGARLVDIGTRFNVLREDDLTRLEVAEGAVEYRSGAAAVRVGPGEQLSATPNELQLSKVDASTVGSWREGRLVFDGDPLALVAAELSRNLGRPVSADSKVATMPVTAVVQLPRDAEQLPAQLERLLGIKVRRQGKGWVLTSAE